MLKPLLMKLKNRLRKIVNKISSKYYLRIKEEWNLRHQVGLDSVELLLMMNYIEEEFKIQVNDDEFLAKDSFGEVIQYVDNKCRAAA